MSACLKDGDSVPDMPPHSPRAKKSRPYTREGGPTQDNPLTLSTSNVQSAELTPGVRLNKKGWEKYCGTKGKRAASARPRERASSLNLSLVGHLNLDKVT